MERLVVVPVAQSILSAWRDGGVALVGERAKESCTAHAMVERRPIPFNQRGTDTVKRHLIQSSEI